MQKNNKEVFIYLHFLLWIIYKWKKNNELIKSDRWTLNSFKRQANKELIKKKFFFRSNVKQKATEANISNFLKLKRARRACEVTEVK